MKTKILHWKAILKRCIQLLYYYSFVHFVAILGKNPPKQYPCTKKSPDKTPGQKPS